jgi:PAS domain S-box-containing protein
VNAPIPPDEAARLAALDGYAVLDTPREQAFDDLTLLAAHICDVPMALVSLVDEKRQWFKSRVRVEDTWTPRDVSFCAHTIMQDAGIFEVYDAEADPRFAGSPLVKDGPRIRFYAGAPLVTPDGHALGALCVMDRVPRQLTPEQRNALQALSRRVIAQLELRKTTAKLIKVVEEHKNAEEQLRQKITQLASAEEETQRLLAVAEKSRRALLSVLEDEKLAGHNLRESEERFRQMTESIDEVFWMSDPALGRMIYMSPAYEKVWGRTCASLYAATSSWIDAVHPDDRERIELAARTKQLAGTYDEVYRIMRPDETVRWIHARTFPVRNAQQKIYRMVGVAQDITEKKELETQFFRAQRLESIGTLASGIAHDLNNILAPIMMAAPLVRTSDSPEFTEKMLGMIESSVQRGAHLVRQLLTFGRGVEGEKSPMSLDPVIHEIVAMARQTFPRIITFSEEVPEKLAPVLADATQMHQILLNLCVNARDAMPHGGMLSINARNVQVDAVAAAANPGAREGAYVLVAVTDTGTGMTPEIADKIFNPFFTTKPVGKGTGLGLATVLGLVKSHDGFLKLRTKVGEGTTFEIYFPAVAHHDGGESFTPAMALAAGNGQLVLVVDDEENIRDTVRGLLIQQGYTAIVAENGIEGVSRFALAQNEVRLVITDLDMPDMDGVAMIKVLRLMNPKLKIIVSSGISRGRQPNDKRSLELTALGIDAFLDKPCTAEQVLRSVQDVLKG